MLCRQPLPLKPAGGIFGEYPADIVTPGATWQLGAAVEGSLWRGKLVISEHQQTAGAGKEAAGGSAPNNYSPEPARARGTDCFLLALMARSITRWARGAGPVAVSAWEQQMGFVTGEKAPGEPRFWAV